ncbi:hypothetical protein MMC10_007557 [Thelotrema lepadinum]|nr:hypothetical protein [Thelotrema lepadinum]
MAWVSPITILLIVSFSVFACAFIYVEKYWAKEPVFPVHLMRHRDIVTTYPVGVFRSIAQMGLMYGIPLHFQIVNGASSLDAGTRLVPAVVGNAIGGLLCGFMIHRSGKYEALTLSGLAFACLGYILIIFRWRQHVGWAETLYIFPGGFGMGVVISTTFIALTAGVAPLDFAVAGAGLYQAHGIGAALGSCVTMSVLQAALRPILAKSLKGIEASDEIIRRSIEDISYVRSLKDPLRDIVISSYVTSLTYTHDNLYSSVAEKGLDASSDEISLEAKPQRDGETFAQGGQTRFYKPIDTYEGIHRLDPNAEWTEKEEKLIVRKLDWKIYAWACFMFFALQLDRGNIVHALTDNMLPDLGLTTNNYNYGMTIFYISFLCAELPSQMIS